MWESGHLYRSLLRQCAQLPHPYLRLFWRIRVSDTFRTRNPLSNVKTKFAKNELKLLQKANRGELESVRKVLECAYGRRGKFKRELLEMVQTFSVTRPGSLASPIPTRQHPPPLSPAMIALSNSSHGRESGKRVGRREFEHPPTLPARADPSSEDARLIGPFSRRRLVNERWRFFKSQVGRLLPPLHIKTEPVVDHIERATALAREYEHSLINPADILHAFLDDASRPRPANVPRKARRDIAADSACSAVNYGHNDPLVANKPQKWTSRQSPRFFRRRHQEILRLLPIMIQTLRHSTVKDSDLNGSHSDPSQLQWKFSVSQSPLALKRRTDSRDISSPPISKEDRTWVEQAEKTKG